MKKQLTTQRTLSAIMALMLAMIVTFMAAIKTYGTTSSEELIVYDIKGSLDRAYEEIVDEGFVFELPADNLETIKVFDSNDKLILSIVKEKDGVVQDENAQRILNKAEYLSSFAGTSIYKVEE